MFKSMKKLFASAPTTKSPAPKTRLSVEGLEDRKLLTAGITLGTDGIIRVEGYDDSVGEAVSVRTLTNNTLSVYDDQIQVTMSHGRNVQSETYDLWKSPGRRQSVAAVTRVNYIGLGGNDSFLNKSNVAATADGGAGDDRLRGGNAQEVLIGGMGNDTLTGGVGADKLSGGAGTDTLVESADLGFTLSDTGIAWADGTGDLFSQIEVADMTGGAGHNVMNAQGFSGQVTLRGGGGNDTMTGGMGANFLYGEDGDDTIRGGALADKLYGGAGNDYLYGNGGNDTLNGDSGLDYIWGGDGDDSLYGGTGKDYLYGEAGNDSLSGSYDHKIDHLYGGGGADTFYQYVWADMDSIFVWEWEYHKDKIHDLTSEDTRFQIQV